MFLRPFLTFSYVLIDLQQTFSKNLETITVLFSCMFVYYKNSVGYDIFPFIFRLFVSTSVVNRICLQYSYIVSEEKNNGGLKFILVIYKRHFSLIKPFPSFGAVLIVGLNNQVFRTPLIFFIK